MTTARLRSKGRITIPKVVREQLRLSAGDRVYFVTTEDGRVAMVPATISITELRGSLPASSRPVTLAEMDEVIAAGAGRQPQQRNI